MEIIIALIFIGLCIYHACEPTLPAEYHRNMKLEEEDANKVRFGEMIRSEFKGVKQGIPLALADGLLTRNMRNGKYK